MTIPVLIEPNLEGGFREPAVPRSWSPLKELLAMKALINRLRLRDRGADTTGAVVVPMEIGPDVVNPSAKRRRGIFRDNASCCSTPGKIVADYRRSVDQDSAVQ